MYHNLKTIFTVWKRVCFEMLITRLVGRTMQYLSIWTVTEFCFTGSEGIALCHYN
uniref:Uncharacterized protein n=1 Tax=Anguilla anguilla TaxID=7936 RepID=A0A0E9TRM1_ANGAN